MMLSDVCLTSDVCLSGVSVAYIGPKSRTERPKGRDQNWYRGGPRHTWLGHHFQGVKVKCQGHQAALLTAVLARQAAAAVGVGTCWPLETAATLPSARRRKALWRPRGRRGAGHIVAAARLQLVCTALRFHRFELHYGVEITFWINRKIFV